MTNYQLAKLVNFKLAEAGLDEVRPQQIYGDRKGLNDLIDPKDIVAYIDRYVAKRKTQSRKNSVTPSEWFAKFGK